MFGRTKDDNPKTLDPNVTTEGDEADVDKGDEGSTAKERLEAMEVENKRLAEEKDMLKKLSNNQDMEIKTLRTEKEATAKKVTKAQKIDTTKRMWDVLADVEASEDDVTKLMTAKMLENLGVTSDEFTDVVREVKGSRKSLEEQLECAKLMEKKGIDPNVEFPRLREEILSKQKKNPNLTVTDAWLRLRYERGEFTPVSAQQEHGVQGGTIGGEETTSGQVTSYGDLLYNKLNLKEKGIKKEDYDKKLKARMKEKGLK